ncbi:sphingosine-1-phosphate lyase [Diachasma alloeum]|uniref:sphingosine-1-phosphate lyase n=1 Tax=Diachasma alloeum TaxID=454923 RepID=UPI0007382A44|nr:sphingosine-1-phosphate lyase [Diachasma alloeum]XP_015109918.1 sphingosine-1-phosphate lyase [Diachasma alloeum]
MDTVKGFVNDTFKDQEPWKIVTITTGSVLSAVWLWNFLHQDESLVERGKKKIFRLVRCLPSVREKIQNELDTLNCTFERESLERVKDVDFVTKLPLNGLAHEQVLGEVRKYIELGEFDWQNGKVSGAVYRYDEKLIKLLSEVYGIASYTNPLHPDIFPGVCKMEAEVVRISCKLFHGDEASCGTMTTGGTESILLACKAYRDYAKDVKGIKNPEMVVPSTVHSAFDKAAQYLNIRVRTVPMNPNSCTVKINDMERAINKNTIMLVGSTPNFPYGTFDNIEAISELGVKYNVPVHVDACLGGFLLCFMPDAGFSVPMFDFKLPGVTSISADTHKYGYAPKGSSVILYRDKKYRHYQFTITTDWPGGIYGSPTVNGSRTGGIIAACWASLMHFGYSGYLESTKKIIETTRYIETELRKMDGIFIFGTPATSVIALGSHQFHIYRLSEGLNTRGWNLNVLQFPSAIHICVTHVHTQAGIADEFLHDVRNILVEIKKHPEEPVEGMFAMYGMSQTIADRTVVEDLTRSFIDSMYFTPSEEIEEEMN